MADPAGGGASRHRPSDKNHGQDKHVSPREHTHNRLVLHLLYREQRHGIRTVVPAKAPAYGLPFRGVCIPRLVHTQGTEVRGADGLDAAALSSVGGGGGQPHRLYILWTDILGFLPLL